MMPMSNLFCLVCSASLDISSCVNIFCTSLPRNGELLANFVSKVLRLSVPELQDSYVCAQCCNLFQMLEQAQKTVLNIRCEILKIYHATERRKSIKQSINNDINLTLSANIALAENKLHISNGDERWEEASNLQAIQIKEVVKQQCIQDKITSQILNLPNRDCGMYAKTAINSKKNAKKKAINCSEVDNTQSCDYNNARSDVKKVETLKSNLFHNSIAAANDNNVYNISSSQANTHTAKMNAEEKECISLIESERSESKDFIKTGSIFSENKLQVQNIVQSIDFEWSEIDENVAEAEENPESSVASKNDRISVPMKPEKVSKCNVKLLKHSCSICGKKWKTSTELKTHMKTHSTLRPYMCEKCGQAYKHKHALEVHVGMHNGINPFQCNFCSKCFTQKGALMRHLPMHTGEMPYQCELCGKRFIHHTSYNMHKLSHSGKKSYKCHMCDLSLLSTSHLKRHTRVHTGEKPYSCTSCGKRFAERYNLLAHQKIHEPFENKAKKANETQYQCDHCNMVFEQKQSLMEHEKCHTDTDNESDLQKSCSVYPIQPKSNELSRKIDFEHGALQQTWIQIPIPEIDESSFAVTFSDEKVSMESTNYNTSLQVIIEPSNTSLLNSNLTPIDKAHI